MRFLALLFAVAFAGCGSEQDEFTEQDVQIEQIDNTGQEALTNMNCPEAQQLMYGAGCPGWTQDPRTWTSIGQVAAFLYSQGYYKTPTGYTGCSGLAGCHDYTLHLATSCGTGVIRRQAIIEGRGSGYYGFRWQMDLNPVITRYEWPAWWWPTYVKEWHRAC